MEWVVSHVLDTNQDHAGGVVQKDIRRRLCTGYFPERSGMWYAVFCDTLCAWVEEDSGVCGEEE